MWRGVCGEVVVIVGGGYGCAEVGVGRWVLVWEGVCGRWVWVWRGGCGYR